MIVLGIETSGRQGSVALLRQGLVVGERELSQAGRRHARTLLGEIRDLLAGTTTSPADVDVIAVSIGPGSFTGLRVGVTCAKTWAYVTRADVVAVDTFRAVALQSTTEAAQLQVIGDAQRGDLFVGRFVREAADWQRTGEIAIVPLDVWMAGLDAETVVSGPGVESLRARLHGRCRVEAAAVCSPRAESVARIGEQSALRGATQDLWGLEPVYLRKSAAEEKAEASRGLQPSPEA